MGLIKTEKELTAPPPTSHCEEESGEILQLLVEDFLIYPDDGLPPGAPAKGQHAV